MTRRVANVVATQGFRSLSSYFAGTNQNDPPVGSTSMTFIAVVRALRAITSSQNFVLHTSGGTGGWRLLVDTAGGGGTWRAQIFDGGSTSRLANVVLPVVANTLYIAGASYVGGTLTHRVNGLVSATGPWVGYTAPVAGQPFMIGALPIGTFSPQDLAIVAFLGSSTVGLDAAGLAAAEAQLQTDLRNGRDLRSALVAGDLIYYDARDAQQGLGGTKDWAPRVGAGVTLTKTGNPYTASYPGRP